MTGTTQPATAQAWWIPQQSPPNPEPAALHAALQQVYQPFSLLSTPQGWAVGQGGLSVIGGQPPAGTQAYPMQAHLPAVPPEMLGSALFRREHRLRYAYIAGAMANGITSTAIVEEMARAGMLGFFGSAGLSLPEVENAIVTLKQNLGDLPFGFNLIHSPNEPELEMKVVQMYHRYGIGLVSASAYLDLTLPLVLYRVKGIHRNAHGQVVCPHRVVAKVSREEVARKFFAPPPAKMLQTLVERGEITAEEAALAAEVPVAHDLTAEADSGGHTDNQSTLVLLPIMIALKDEFQTRYNYARPLCVGLAGGIATPVSAAAAFAMGADYIVTGSINQSCVESGTSDIVRQMLVKARQADVTMAPAADMFEMGVKVQVLKWGTMFAMKGRKLYDLYRQYDSLEALPDAERTVLERDYFRATLEEAWASTEAFFAKVDPSQNVRAARDPHHKMALVFRAYLGLSSKWANAGDDTRKVDYQIWCGPAMGAFNAWVKGTCLDPAASRRVAVVGLNLMLGAAVLTRIHGLQVQGVVLPPSMRQFAPLPAAEIAQVLGQAVG